MAIEQKIDWASIEREFRETSMSVREIARANGVSESAIRKRRKAEEWVRTARDGAHEETEIGAFLKAEQFSLSEVRILANTFGIPGDLEDEFDLAKASRGLAMIALTSLAHLTVAAKSEAVRRQAAHELLTWGYGKPLGIVDQAGRSRSKPKARVLGKKEAMAEAAQNPDPNTTMGSMMARRAANLRNAH